MKDLGSASLVAELLILQRQGEFEDRKTVSRILTAEIGEDEVLLFDFETPLNERVSRKTIAKAIFRDGALYVCWVSSLKSKWTAERERVFYEIRNSFKLS